MKSDVFPSVIQEGFIALSEAKFTSRMSTTLQDYMVLTRCPENAQITVIRNVLENVGGR